MLSLKKSADDKTEKHAKLPRMQIVNPYKDDGSELNKDFHLCPNLLLYLLLF